MCCWLSYLFTPILHKYLRLLWKYLHFKKQNKNVKHLKYESKYKKLIVRISLPLDIHLYGLKKKKINKIKLFYANSHSLFYAHVHNGCENIHIFTYKSESKIRDVKQYDV